MNLLRITLTTTKLDKDKAFEVVNAINANEEGDFELRGVVENPVPFENISTETLSIEDENGEDVNVIYNDTYKVEFIQSESIYTKVGDAFYINGLLYKIIQLEDNIFLYSFSTNKVLYKQHESTSLEELRETIESNYESIFFKRI